MSIDSKTISIYKFWNIIAFVTLIGGILRIVNCFLGYPLHLHPDEPTIVKNAIDMLARHSWEAYVYNRPDQFEIKCNALFFTIVSWIKYHVPAYNAFKTHEITFYLTARIYTSFFGIALIPLAAVVTGRITGYLSVNKKIAQISCALLIAFSSIFVRHSAYSTPDIPLTFLIVLFTYMFIEYTENGGFKRFALSCIIIGIGITIKYPAAVLCMPLAFMIIYRAALIEKNLSAIWKSGIIGGLIIFSVIFVIAPNLFTDFDNVYSTILKEARPNHLGQDGLGFGGNLIYYLQHAIENLGWESALLACLGMYTVVNSRQRIPIFAIGIGLLYWTCISTLSLHWLRWGIPIFSFYDMVVAIGIGKVADILINNSNRKKSVVYSNGSMLSVIAVLIIVNVVLSGIAITKSSLLTDTRPIALKYCNNNKITKRNTLYEAYSSLSIIGGDWNAIVKGFKLEKREFVLKAENRSKKYLMYSSFLRDSRFREEKKYRHEVKVYKTIEKNYPLIYKLSADGNYWNKRIAVENILCSLRYLRKKHTTIGYDIYVYKIR